MTTDFKRFAPHKDTIVTKKTELEMFAEEFKQLQAKYPNIQISSDYGGELYAEDMSASKTTHIYL